MWTKNGCAPSAVGTAKYTGTGEIFAVYHNAKRRFSSVALPAAEIIRNAGLRFPNERFRRLRQAAVFLPLQKLQHLRA